MRIVHFLNWCEAGGTVDMIVALMRRSQYTHTYLTYRATDARRAEFAHLGLNLVEIGSEDIHAAVEYVKQHADILHAANSGGPEPGVAIGLQAGVPVIETCQSPSLPSGHLEETVRVVAVSQGILQYWGDFVKNARVIYSCSEPIPEYNREEAIRSFGLDPSRPVIGRVGRLEPIKRAADFVLTIPHIARERRDAQFLLVGGGSDENGLQALTTQIINQTGVPIVMPGFLSGEDKTRAYRAIDIFLYPTSMEGFGCVFAEAMSCGLPIVTYSDPVNIDIVDSAGVFVIDNLFTNHPDPYLSLASTTLDLLYNERDAKKLGERSLTLYNQRYKPERMAIEYDQLYDCSSRT